MSKLIGISDEDYLKALLKLMDSSSAKEEKVKLTKEERAGTKERINSDLLHAV